MPAKHSSAPIGPRVIITARTEGNQRLLKSAEEERDLMARALEGDRDAFPVLMRQHQAGVRTLILRIVRDERAGDELAEEVFFRAFRRLDRLRFHGALEFWLYKAAVNLSFTQLRKRWERSPSLPDESPLAEPAGRLREPTRTPSDDRGAPHESRGAPSEASGTLTVQPLEAAWVRLPPLHRAIVALRLPLGRSYEEIGAILAMPEEAVMGRLRRARQSLRCVLVAPQAAATEGPSRDCPRIREWLDAYLDRELASTDRRRIERHREECAPCREYLRDVESIERALLDRWRAEEPPRAELDAWAKRFAARPDLEAARRAWRIEPKRPWIRRLLRP